MGVVAAIAVLASPGSALAVGLTPMPDQSFEDPRWTGPGFDLHRVVRDNEEHADVNVCSNAISAGHAHCDARARTDPTARGRRPAPFGQSHPAAATVGNSGAYDPSYLQSAYNVASSIAAGAGAGQVVAIVDAYDNPNVASDLGQYRSWFGLPALPTCASWPSATPCFSKINQDGGTTPPAAADAGWALEISLDVDMVSAICPSCTILLVEANSNSYGDLFTAVNQAVAKGANVVSNSYGGGEWSGETAYDSVFNRPGVAITVSSGDGGYGVEFPAASQFVTAVGGTTLNQATNTGARSATETAWSGAGSGCSQYEAKPTWQTDPGCGNRTVADVSAVADPNTGVWVYDTDKSYGWNIVGGTSAAAPIIGATYALAGNNLSSGQMLSSDPYRNTGALFDITGGSNGTCGNYLCNGVAGYDGPTGLGTPNGFAAFANSSSAVQQPPQPQPQPDFTMAANTSTLRATRGGTTVSDALTLTATNGYHSSVQLSVSGAPAGVTASFSTSLLTPTANTNLRVRASMRAVAGTYPLTITARGADGTTHTLTVSLTVQ